MRLVVVDPPEMVRQFSHLGSHRHDQIFGVVELKPISLVDKLTDAVFEVSERCFVVCTHVALTDLDLSAGVHPASFQWRWQQLSAVALVLERSSNQGGLLVIFLFMDTQSCEHSSRHDSASEMPPFAVNHHNLSRLYRFRYSGFAPGYPTYGHFVGT